MGPSQASAQFIIDNQYYYVDLDDLLVNHVKAMSRKVDDLMAAEKYKGGSDQELRGYLSHATVPWCLAHWTFCL
jgi:transcription elongation factor SPT6